jgi:hypothetical protein
MLQAERAENMIEKYLQIKISNGGFNKVQDIELPSKIGRCPKHDDYTSQLALESPYVSREHIMIEPENVLFWNKRVILIYFWPCFISVKDIDYGLGFK